VNVNRHAPAPAAHVSAFSSCVHVRACRVFCVPQRIYSGGACEPVVGQCLEALRLDGNADRVRVTTKAHPSQPGGLSKEGLESQLQASLDALGVTEVRSPQGGFG
jgi:hypothetical protein